MELLVDVNVDAVDDVVVDIEVVDDIDVAVLLVVLERVEELEEKVLDEVKDDVPVLLVEVLVRVVVVAACSLRPLSPSTTPCSLRASVVLTDPGNPPLSNENVKPAPCFAGALSARRSENAGVEKA
mmetsp:Transcript_574/g.1311  ORF Transcript_574/g.1311 Transcript_574/m.1311 type:complete len:126 (-) Transcript_574:102-479(-)